MVGQQRPGRPRKEKVTLSGQALRRAAAHRPALHEEARDQLRSLIVRGMLPPGGSVGEIGLSDALGMSRTPIREALKLLASEGLVEIRSNRGAFVTPIRWEQIPDLFEVMAGVERLGAELAAERGTVRDLAQLRRLQERMEAHHDAGKLEAYFDLNQQIHRGIVAAARNQVLTSTHELLFPRVERVRFFALGSHPRWDESVREHREVLAALTARDSDRAGEALARHVRHTGERAMERLRHGAAAEPVIPASDLASGHEGEQSGAHPVP